MQTPTIQQFNLFNLQHGSNHDTHIRIQETIYYASRFNLAILVSDTSSSGTGNIHYE